MLLFKIKDMSGWYLTDISGHVRVAPQQDLQPPHHISTSSGEARRALAQDYFWSAPAPYLGNKVSPYAVCFSPLCFNRSIKEWALFSICLKKDKRIKHMLYQIAWNNYGKSAWIWHFPMFHTRFATSHSWPYIYILISK